MKSNKAALRCGNTCLPVYSSWTCRNTWHPVYRVDNIAIPNTYLRIQIHSISKLRSRFDNFRPSESEEIHLNSWYLSKFLQSWWLPCLFVTMTMKESREHTRANPRRTTEPLFSQSSLLHRLKAAGASKADVAAGFSMSAAGGAVGEGTAGDESACFVVAGSWAVVMFANSSAGRSSKRRMISMTISFSWMTTQTLLTKNNWIRGGYTVD